ncbi:MAG: hypothetical protein KJ077_06630 [Anaerolineae bacterium]|nr:hypothetical protein [Anaerolineae bacterium]
MSEEDTSQSLNRLAKDVILELKKHLTDIGDENSIEFIQEAIACFENKLFRAAVVLSWVGTVSVLQNHIINKRLTDFNIEAKRRNPKWRDAQSVDDLGQMKESELLDVLEYLSVIGNNVKLELKKCLQLRNSCGHPNSLSVGPNQVAAHLETLILNIFSNENLVT